LPNDILQQQSQPFMNTLSWSANRRAVVALTIVLWTVSSLPITISADDKTPDPIGRDAPHQERNSAQDPAEFAKKRPFFLRALPFFRDGAKRESKKEVVATEREEVKPSAAELAARRRAKLAKPAPIGSDAPHQERNSRPDVHALRLFTFEPK
jgi:hypothetical protein